MIITNNNNQPYIEPEIIEVEQIPGITEEQLNAPTSVKNINGGGGVGNNWAYGSIGPNGSAPAATTTVLPIHKGFDGGGCVSINTTNNTLVVSEDGLYGIQALCSFGISNSERLYTRIKVNGNSIGIAQYYRTPSSTTIYYYPINLSGLWYLNSGDEVSFVVYGDGTIDWSQQDVNNWDDFGTHNEQGGMLQVYKL